MKLLTSWYSKVESTVLEKLEDKEWALGEAAGQCRPGCCYRYLNLGVGRVRIQQGDVLGGGERERAKSVDEVLLGVYGQRRH